MQNSAKHLTAALIGFAAYITCSLIIGLTAGDEASLVLTEVLSILQGAILTAICIIITLRHKKNRRYFFSLSMVMLCNCFAGVYLGLYLLIHETPTSTLPISDIAFLGVEAFLAALCARIWYEEIPKAAVNRKKIAAVTIAAVLFVLAVGVVSLLGGGPVISTYILYLIFDGAILCYSLRFFTVSRAAKPFRPLMVIISIYAVYDILNTFISPLFYDVSAELTYYILAMPMILLTMLFISFLVLAGERMPEKTEQNTAAEGSAAAEKGAVLSDAGGMK